MKEGVGEGKSGGGVTEKESGRRKVRKRDSVKEGRSGREGGEME